MTVYKFTEKRDIVYRTRLVGFSYDSEWVTMYTSGEVVIKGTNKNGYSWDGCSPKMYFMGGIIGTPDGELISDFPESIDKPITYYASMLHDVLYQNKATLPYSRADVDLEFKRQLELKKFKFASVYYFFVRKFGGMYGKWKIK